VLTGHYSLEGESLRVTIEAIDVATESVVWRNTLLVPQQNMIQLQRELTDSIYGGLFDRLGAQPPLEETRVQPKDEQAYDAYLRSLASADDPIPNKHAIESLELAVIRDPGYAPAWSELFRRYYYAYHYGGEGPAAIQRAEAALERALTLDPDFPAAVGQKIRLRVEQGEIKEALEEARRFATLRPADSMVHFTLAYPLRYAGALHESCRECDLALALDPANPWLRTCSKPFAILGDYGRAIEFVHLDPGGEWATQEYALILMRQGKMTDALAEWQRLPPDSPRNNRRALIKACLQHRDSSEIDAAARTLIEDELPNLDPERKYEVAALLAVCDRRADAIRFLRLAVDGQYCSYPAMDIDPLFENIRGDPEFSAVRDAAIQCHRRILGTLE
jgi:tetratricopeptide (TPR) repeat protein